MRRGRPGNRDVSPSAPKTETNVHPLRILVIEDSPDVGDQLAILLRHRGNEVRLERTGEAGVTAVGEFKPEAVLLDIGLPDLDGHDVATRIRSVAGFEHVTIIGLSGYDATEKERAADSGFDEFLTKPVLPSAIEAALAKRSG